MLLDSLFLICNKIIHWFYYILLLLTEKISRFIYLKLLKFSRKLRDYNSKIENIKSDIYLKLIIGDF